MSSGLPLTIPLTFREKIIEGYYPKLIRSSNSRVYPGRSINQVLSDINRIEEGSHVEITDMEEAHRRVVAAITSGFAIDVSKHIQLFSTYTN